MTEERRVSTAAAWSAGVLRSTPTATIGISDDGRIVSWNPAAEALYGFAASELMGRGATMLVPTAAAPDLAAALLEATRSGMVSQEDTVHVRADGQPVSVDTTLFRVSHDGEPLGVCLTVCKVDDRVGGRQRDAEERAELERAVERMQAQADVLLESNLRLEELAAVASHDLAEPLRAISGFATLLANRYVGRLDEDADEFIGFIVDGCTRMQALIDDLLVYARVSSPGRPAVAVDVGATIDPIVAELQASAPPGTVVEVGPLPVVLGDRERIGVLFQNLVANALKFHAPDERPVVRVRGEPGAEPGLPRFTVEDEGIGIATEHRDEVFRMFRRLHLRKEYPGTGMGLAICQRIVTDLGGSIWVETREGGGTKVCFTLRAAGEIA